MGAEVVQAWWYPSETVSILLEQFLVCFIAASRLKTGWVDLGPPSQQDPLE